MTEEMPAGASGATESPTVADPGHRALRSVERLLMVAGLGILAYLLHDLGLGVVLTHLHMVGWGIVLIVVQEIFAFVANTTGWRLALPDPSAVRFRTLLAARIAGDAVNYLTPTATLGGEFARSRLLRHHAPTTSIVASLAVAKVTQAVGLWAFVAVGLIAFVDEALLPTRVRWGLLVGLGGFAVALVILIVAQRRGMFAPIARLLEGRARRHGPAQLGHALRRVDQEIARLHTANPRRLVLSSASFCLGFALGSIESYLVLWFLGLPATVERALSIEILSVAFNNLLFFVPLRAGTQEAGKVLIFTALGLDPAKGLAAGILYRVRELAWALIGLAILYRQQRVCSAPMARSAAVAGGERVPATPRHRSVP